MSRRKKNAAVITGGDGGGEHDEEEEIAKPVLPQTSSRSSKKKRKKRRKKEQSKQQQKRTGEGEILVEEENKEEEKEEEQDLDGSFETISSPSSLSLLPAATSSEHPPPPAPVRPSLEERQEERRETAPSSAKEAAKEDGVFVTTLVCDPPSLPLGLGILNGRNQIGCFVKRIRPGGAVEAWNRECLGRDRGQQLCVQPGDQIIGLEDRDLTREAFPVIQEVLVAAAKTRKPIRVTFKRLSPSQSVAAAQSRKPAMDKTASQPVGDRRSPHVVTGRQQVMMRRESGRGRSSSNTSFDEEQQKEAAESHEESHDRKKARFFAREDVFQVRMVCPEGSSLGLLVQDGEWGEGIVVRTVRPQGVVMDWNRQQPTRQTQVQPGDIVYSVNGQTVVGLKYSRARLILIRAAKSGEPFELVIVKSDQPPPSQGQVQGRTQQPEDSPKLLEQAQDPQGATLQPQRGDRFSLTDITVESLARGRMGGDALDILDANSAIAAIRSSVNALLTLTGDAPLQDDGRTEEDPSAAAAAPERRNSPPSAEDDLPPVSRVIQEAEEMTFRIPLGVLFLQGGRSYRTATVRTETGQAVLSLVPSGNLSRRLTVRRPEVFRDVISEPGEILVRVTEKLFSVTQVFRIRRPHNEQIYATVRRFSGPTGIGFMVFRGQDYSDQKGVLLFRTLGDVKGHSFLVLNARSQAIAAVFPRGLEEYCVRITRGVDVGLLLTCIVLFEESPTALSFPASRFRSSQMPQPISGVSSGISSIGQQRQPSMYPSSLILGEDEEVPGGDWSTLLDEENPGRTGMDAPDSGSDASAGRTRRISI